MAKRRIKKAKTNDQSGDEQPDASEETKYVSAYKRAEKKFAEIQAERQQKFVARQKEADEKNRRLEENLSFRKKMNKALKKRTKKGQPKLDSQMELLLEKIKKRANKPPASS